MKSKARLFARLASLAIFLVTWIYGVTTYSAFAFDMFVKPRLFEPLNAFADWQHAWFTLAYALSVSTLVGVMRGRGGTSPRQRVAQLLAIAYAVAIGAVAIWLIGHPYLPSLTTGSHPLAAVPGALLPAIWLAVIDHLANPATPASPSRRANARDVFIASLGTAAVLSFAALAVRAITTHQIGGVIAVTWAAALNVSVFAIAAFAFWCVTAFASARRNPAAWEYAAGVLFLAVAIEELVRQIILPPIGFASADRILIAVPFGLAASTVLSGLLVMSGKRRPDQGIAGLLAITDGRAVRAGATIVTTLIAAAAALYVAAGIDWASILQQCLAFMEGLLVFGALLAFRRRHSSGAPAPVLTMAGLSVGAIVLLQGLAHLPAGRAGVPPQAAVEDATRSDGFAHLVSAIFVAQPPLDVGFYSRMSKLDLETWMRSPAPPPSLARQPIAAAPSLPNVFVFVFDSLRRDYLSTYNPAVTFTPAIGAWSRESHVFENAFTPHGGTLLAAPAIWAGRTMPRGWAGAIRKFDLMEDLITSLKFDFLLNDSPTEEFLRPQTKVTALDPFVPRVQTDLCQNLSALETHLRARRDSRPVFAFSQPMNLHILNTLVSSGEPDYPGFYAPYAARLERMDQCFGHFIDYLKTSGLYDNSIIVLSSDHGDMLGEDGRWGHQAFLLPEVVRVPLIVRLPPAMAATRTTDLGRVALVTDLAPTLLTLLTTSGAADDSPPNGATLYVPRDQSLRPRDRDSFLLIASYGPTLGVLRRNGRELYAVDLARVREYDFNIEPWGPRELAPAAGRRRVAQAELSARVDELRRLYDRR